MIRQGRPILQGIKSKRIDALRKQEQEAVDRAAALRDSAEEAKSRNATLNALLEQEENEEDKKLHDLLLKKRDLEEREVA